MFWASFPAHTSLVVVKSDVTLAVGATSAQQETSPCPVPLWKVTGASSGISGLRWAGQSFAEVTSLGASWVQSLVHAEGPRVKKARTQGGLWGDQPHPGLQLPWSLWI